jgi:elongation factor G
VLVALVGDLGQGAVEDGDQPLRQRADVVLRRREGLVDDAVGDHREVVAAEGLLAGQHLVEDDAQGEDVGPVVDVAPLDLLRRHVVGGAQELPVVGEVRGVEPRDAEVGELDPPLAGDEDVGGLDVAVHHPLGVGVLQGLGDLPDDVADALEVHRRFAPQQLLEVGAADELHGDEGGAVLVDHVVDGNDVGVGEDAGALRLADEALPALAQLLVLHLPDAEGLERHQPADEGVLGQIHHPHRTLADLVEDLIPAEPCRGRCNHGLIRRPDRHFRPPRQAASNASKRSTSRAGHGRGRRRPCAILGRPIRNPGERPSMQVESPDKIRNLAVAGHNDTGKTTLASALLYAGGVTNRLNRVEDRNTLTDFDAEEIERGISIGLAPCFVPWRGHKVNLIDCPGYGIFFTETRAGMRATDALLLAVNAVSGVEVTTETAWRAAAEMDQPVIVHLTKMDRERADFGRSIEALAARFGREVQAVQLPIGVEAGFAGVVDLVHLKAYRYDRDGDGRAAAGEVPAEAAAEVAEWRNKLIEAVAETDDALLERFFEQGELSQDELEQGLRKAVAARRLFPVTLGAALHGIGPSALLDALVDLAPSPLDRGSFPAANLGGEAMEVAADPDAPVAALVFKTLSDPFSGKISILRVVAGRLASDSTVWNPRLEESARLGQLMAMQGKQGTAVPALVAGDIGGVAKLKDAASGDTLSARERPLKLAWIKVPEPAISFAVEPKSKGDEEKIGEALHRLIEEDPTLRVSRDPNTHEYLLSGTGQLHVEIAVAKLKGRSKVEVILHPPKVPYRETIGRAADGHGRHKKQTGGRGQFADCRIKIEPLPRGEDFEFLDQIFGGSIPQNFRPAVEKGIQEARRKGYLAGYPVVDFRVRLLDGQYHDVDSSELAFKIAGSLAFKDAMAQAGPTLLEPMMKLVITTSEDFMGDIMSDLSQRRGRPQGMEARDGSQVVTATVPMAETLEYARSLRAMTQGRSTFSIEFSHYEEVPRQVQEKIIAAAQREKEEEG